MINLICNYDRTAWGVEILLAGQKTLVVDIKYNHNDATMMMREIEERLYKHFEIKGQ